MKKIEEIINKTLMPVAQLLATNRFMIALKNGMVKITPLTMIGSFFLVIAQLPEIFTFLPSYSESLYNTLYLPYTMTFGILGLVAAGGVAYSLAEQDEKLNPYMVSISTILVFITVCAPIQNGVMSAANFGAEGIFVGIILGLLIPECIRFIEGKNLKIKMPDTVPPNITASFESIIPMGIVLIIFYSLSVLCQNMTGGLLIPDLVKSLLTPAINGMENIWFVVIIMFFVQVLFFFGIHGASILFGFITPFAVANTAANAEAFAAGITPEKAFTLVCLYMGGYFYPVWSVLFMKCKSKRLNTIGKVSLVPAIFNIQEPMQFGAPIMLNPFLFIPYILTNAIGVGLTYWVMEVGIINCAAISVPSILPQPFMGVIATFDWKCIILWLVMVAVNYIIWKPFISAYDKQILLEDGE